MNKTFLERKSVYHVPGTNCLLWAGMHTHSCERFIEVPTYWMNARTPLLPHDGLQELLAE
jgi:hypothetical protein